MAPLRWARVGVRATRAIVGALGEASRDVVDQLSRLTLSVYATPLTVTTYSVIFMSRGVLSICSWVLSGDDFQNDRNDVFVALDLIALPAALEGAPG